MSHSFRKKVFSFKIFSHFKKVKFLADDASLEGKTRRVSTSAATASTTTATTITAAAATTTTAAAAGTMRKKEINVPATGEIFSSTTESILPNHCWTKQPRVNKSQLR